MRPILPHAIAVPGTATILSNVAAAQAHSVYVGAVPAEITTPASFGELAREVKRTSGALVLGVRAPETNDDRINPPDDLEVPAGAKLVYLAERPVLGPK